MNAKLLFHGIPGTTEGDLTTGPASGKVWLVKAIYIANTNAAAKKVTLKHYIDGTYTRTLVHDTSIGIGETKELGPIVVEYGHKIRALQETADAIQITAYGLEETL